MLLQKCLNSYISISEFSYIFIVAFTNITDAVLAATLKDLIEVGIVERKSYDEIPPRVEYMLAQKGKSVVPILQNICQWSGVFYKDDVENEILQCQRCDHNR